MKRDMDLIREILLAIEARPAGELIRTIEIPKGFTPEEAIGHLRLINQAGYLDGKFETHGKTALIAIHGLSNRGHDFLDAVRSETIWNKTKERLTEVGGAAALETVKALAVSIGAKLLGLP